MTTSDTNRFSTYKKIEYGFIATSSYVVVEGLLELFAVAQKLMVVKRFDCEDLLQLQRTEVMVGLSYIGSSAPGTTYIA